MDIDKLFLQQLEQKLQAPQYLQWACHLPADKPWYEVMIYFDPQTGIEVHRSYCELRDRSIAFEPQWEYEILTIDAEAYKRGEGLKIVYPQDPLKAVIR